MMPVGRGAWCRFDRRQSGLSGPTGRHYELMGRAPGVEPKTLLVDGYNVIRRTPALAAAERHSLAGGRDPLLTAPPPPYPHPPHPPIAAFDPHRAAARVGGASLPPPSSGGAPTRRMRITAGSCAA